MTQDFEFKAFNDKEEALLDLSGYTGYAHVHYTDGS